jgi:hypothetical protein
MSACSKRGLATGASHPNSQRAGCVLSLKSALGRTRQAAACLRSPGVSVQTKERDGHRTTTHTRLAHFAYSEGARRSRCVRIQTSRPAGVITGYNNRGGAMWIELMQE